jgi:DNA-binding NarL/FixJ family response regulator
MISIIDDDDLVRDATKGLVRSLGYEAATFASAEAFLDSSALRETVCIITDVQMKGLSGIELQERLAANVRRVPIVFMTAFPDARLCARVMELGAIGFLSKPFKHETLIACLEKAWRPTDWRPVCIHAPFDCDLELAVIDDEGVHALVFPCRRILDHWINAETQKPIDLRPTHWRDWGAPS